MNSTPASTQFTWLRLFEVTRSALAMALRDLSARVIEFLHTLARICFLHGDYHYAAIALQTALHIKHDDAFALFGLVDLYVLCGNEDHAIAVLENWIKLFPDDLEARLAIARLQAMGHDPENAVAHLQICAQLSPQSPAIPLAYAILHRWNGSLDEAQVSLRAALQHGEVPEALFQLGENLIDQGDKERAILTLERLIQLAPFHSSAYYNLARCKYYNAPTHPHLALIRQLLSTDRIAPPSRAALHFALGEALDSMGQWDDAFEHFRAGNDLYRGRFNFRVGEMARTLHEIVKIFEDGSETVVCGEHPTKGTLGESLVFIVGMPRSGSTLVEQILASHPAVHPGGERHDVGGIIRRVQRATDSPYPACVRELRSEAQEEIAEAHLTEVLSRAPGALRFVDKGLNTYMDLGIIKIIFPQAKIIHCKRNALDTCFSCYRHNLAAVPYSHDLRTLGLVYRQYARMMSFWHSIFPDWVLDMTYEALVSEPETQVRRLLAFCELPWHPECLSPEKTARPVNTASSLQVKSPIHTRAIGHWKNYEAHLQPLVAILGNR